MSPLRPPLTALDLLSAIVREPLTVTPTTTVLEAIVKMSGVRSRCKTTRNQNEYLDDLHLEAQSSCVIVQDQGQVLGILTERDIVRLSSQQRSLETLAIQAVMTTPVVTLHESAFTDLFVALNLLQHYQIRHLPILDDQDCLVGLITYESLRQMAQPRDFLRLRSVAEVMSSEVIWATPDQSMLAIANLMTQHRISSVMIVQSSLTPSQNIPIGVITERDLVQFQALGLDLGTCPVAMVMSTPVFTIQPEESLWTVQQIMQQHFIHRLAVVGNRGELLGIVTQSSLLQALNPIELYKLAQLLEAKVMKLEAEKLELLKKRALELEQQVETRTKALAEKAKQERVLSTITDQIHASLDLQQILDTTVQGLRTLLSCDRVIIYQFLPGWRGVVIAEAITEPERSVLYQEVHDPCVNEEWLEPYRQGTIRIANDVYDHNITLCHQEMLVGFDIRSKLMLPIVVEEQLWGLMLTSYRQVPHEWTTEEIELGRQVSLQVAIAIGQATTHQKLQEELNERRQAEVRLQESERRYATLVEVSPVGIFRHDPQGSCIYANERCCQITGLTPEQALGYNWQQGIHPEDRAGVLSQWQQVIEKQSPCQFEFRFQHPDGKAVWVYVQCVPEFDAEAHIIGFVGSLTDISDRKQAELALKQINLKNQAILTALPDLLFRMGADGVYRELITHRQGLDYVQQTVARTGKTMAELLPPELAQRQMFYLQKALQTGELQVYEQQIQINNRFQDEEIRVVKSGEDEALFMIRDISDRKQAERNLQHLNQALEAKVKERTYELVQVNSLQQAILNSADYSIISTDSQGIIQTFNAAAERMLGYTAAEMVGKMTPALIHDAQEIMNRAAFLSTELNQEIEPGFEVFVAKARQGEVHEHEWTYIRKDGSRFPVSLSVTALYNRLGQIIGFLGIAQDISDRKQAEQKIRQQAEREALLREITKRIRQSLDLQQIFDTATQEIRRFLQADRVGIFKFTPGSRFNDGEFVSESVVAGFVSVVAIKIHDHCFGDRFARLYQQGRIQATHDVETAGLEPCHQQVLARFQVRANLILPLLNGTELWGLLCIHQCSRPRQWQQTEIDLTQEISNQLAIAVQQANLYQKVQSELVIRQQAEAAIARQLQQQQTLGAIIQQIRESLEIPQILATVSQQIKQILQADRVIVFRLFPEGKSQIVEEAVAPEFMTLKNRHWDDEVWSQEILDCYLQGKPRIVPDVMNDIWTDCLKEYSQAGQIQSKIVAPILQEVHYQETHRWVSPKGNHKLWGVIVVYVCQEQRVWQESEAQFLQQIANQLAIAIQQASLFLQLQQELKERQQAQQQLTERNEQLAISNQELARATRLKDEFLANMSHELRTPLNAILGMTEGLQEEVFGKINKQQIKALETIERSGSHLLELINDILDLAKIEAGQIQLKFSPTAIAPLFRSSLAFIKQQAMKKHLRLEMKLPPHLPDLFIDERRIRQVLINLLNNAVKFTPEQGKITLEVSFHAAPTRDSTSQTYLRIAVEDTGIGIAPEDVQRVFQPFIQIDSALSRQYEGTGLGLALVKRIIELHDGQVGLTSEVGVGSCFWVDIPYSASEFSCSTFASLPNADFEAATPEEQVSPLVLLAEDNEANILTISSYLEAKGYRLILANNGQEAIALAQSQHPDLILMDIQMPGMDGLEAIQHIRHDPNLVDIPIIALTALAMQGDRDRCLAAGANDYLSKPIKLKQLTTTIQHLLAAARP